jgi:hypothetical protein
MIGLLYSTRSLPYSEWRAIQNKKTIATVA